ncbi:MAG TPA: hypothetical protein VJS63_05060 [Bradyrhizobium sp.]|nr:hypothetical protein [Bradyrhizobium sp.]
MSRKSFDPPSDPQRGLGTDYALIATGGAAALIALIYLLLT